jgi:hypothetical protein
MNQPVYLGVDGGGTKTRFALIDADGRLLGEAELGTTYHPHVGLDGVRAVLAEGVTAVLAAAGHAPGDIAHAFFGLPAYGEDSRATALLKTCPATVLGHDRYTCDNDMVCGWAGSLACADGINIVAGTEGATGVRHRHGLVHLELQRVAQRIADQREFPAGIAKDPDGRLVAGARRGGHLARELRQFAARIRVVAIDTGADVEVVVEPEVCVEDAVQRPLRKATVAHARVGVESAHGDPERGAFV